jgi:hypothetical protein
MGTSGQKPHEPTDVTRAKVSALSGYGIPQEQIAADIGITVPTLHKYYRAELDAGIRKANAAVVRNLHRQATKDTYHAVTAAIWWTKTRMGWRGESLEVTGKDGGPLQVENVATQAIGELMAQLAAAKSGAADAEPPRLNGHAPNGHDPD